MAITGKKLGMLAGALVATLLTTNTALAVCKPRSISFNTWLEGFKKDAIAKGIAGHIVNQSLEDVRYDPKVVAKDRRQSVFSQSFQKFAGRMISKHRIRKGKQLLKKYGSTFRQIEQKYGVPGPVLVAFWGLETDFGAFLGDTPTLQSLATMAYDCRRSELFTDQLLAALKIIDRGDLTKDQMKGPWAGELGQMQFLPTHYIEYGVDFDGDGRVNLIESIPDVLASSANYMKHLGWKPGQPWLQQVQVPNNMPWDQADIEIKHPRSQWAKWGVTTDTGRNLKADNLPATLLLPMGRYGPAFLAYPNFINIYLEWNKSLLYSNTAAFYAARLSGAGPLNKPSRDIQHLSLAQIKLLQSRLAERGYDVGKIDGIIGLGTRKSVRDMQKKLGMAADAYPTPELLDRLQ